jgi:hypothetical protein
MPNRAQGRSGFAIVELIIVLVVLVLFYFLLVRPIGNLANKTDKYLGTSNDPRTLVGHIEENNQFHREQYTKIACALWKLENPGRPVPDPCPPGGPTSRPTTPPPKL